jgi:hypothetical protein
MKGTMTRLYLASRMGFLITSSGQSSTYELSLISSSHVHIERLGVHVHGRGGGAFAGASDVKRWCRGVRWRSVGESEVV